MDIAHGEGCLLPTNHRGMCPEYKPQRRELSVHFAMYERTPDTEPVPPSRREARIYCRNLLHRQKFYPTNHKNPWNNGKDKYTSKTKAIKALLRPAFRLNRSYSEGRHVEIPQRFLLFISERSQHRFIIARCSSWKPRRHNKALIPASTQEQTFSLSSTSQKLTRFGPDGARSV